MKHFALLLICGLAGRAFAQETPASPAPLPDVSTLMKQVEANQKAAEEMQKNYIYKTALRVEKLDGKGDVKKTQSDVYENFWLSGTEVSRHIEHDGKPLSPDDARKEEERIQKQADKAREKRDKAEAQGKQTDSRGDARLPVSRYLELGAFSNPRRVDVNGRSTIEIDFTGDPKARTYNDFEKVVKDLAGTLWVDEQDKELERLDAHLLNNFKIAGGLVANFRKGTQFTITNRKINDEVWLTEGIHGNGHIRLFLFFAADGDFEAASSDYRKFKGSAKILPNFTPVPDSPRQ